MGEKFDAASRLTDGLPSVDDVQRYVSACHALGYRHPDLTLHAAQVRDWYGTEDGLNLSALDADCAALRAVAASAEDALTRQDDQLAAMPAAWQGRGADASQEFLRRHRDAAALAVAAVRTAAEALGDLRDRLWRSIDSKVATVVAVGDRVQGQRGEWLAAAHAVTTGAGDQAAASELVDQQVKPFVDNIIGAEWLTAMRTAIAAVTAAYDAASAELASLDVEPFEVPGDLGPSWTLSRDDDGATTTPAAGRPSGAVVWGPPSTSPPMALEAPPAASVPAPPAAPPPAAVAPVDPAAAAPAMPPPSMPSLGGGVPDVGGGLSGLGQQIGETLGSLFGSADELAPELHDPSDAEEPDEGDEVLDEVDETDDEDDEVDQDDDVEAAAVEEEADEAVEPAADTVCEPAPEAVELPETTEPPPLSEPVPTPAPMPPSEPPPLEPPPSPVADDETPCEIAVGELPQVGE